MTLDTDIALLPGVPFREQNIRSRLIAHGFEEEFHGYDQPPATHYRLGNVATGFYAEFLTPLVGAVRNRKGRRTATEEISGITSQRLRHVELLLLHPWTIDFASPGITARIRIANPVSFIAQKVLILARRDPGGPCQRHSVYARHAGSLRIGPRGLEGIGRGSAQPELHANQARVLSKASEVLFGELTDDSQTPIANRWPTGFARSDPAGLPVWIPEDI